MAKKAVGSNISDTLNGLYRNELRSYKNFFQPAIKLKEKIRINGEIQKKYDEIQAPYFGVISQNHQNKISVSWLDD